MRRIYETREVLSDLDKTDFDQQYSTVVSTTSITITLAAVTGQKHYLHNVHLTGTTGTGGTPQITVAKGSTTVWTGAFTVATDFDKDWARAIVGAEAGTLVIKAAATNLTAGILSIVGYTK